MFAHVFRGNWRIGKNVFLLDRDSSIQVLLPLFHAMQNESGRQELEGAAHGKVLVTAICDLLAAGGVEHGAAEMASAFLFDSSQPVGDGVDRFGEEKSARE